jgi:hypothetical protein
MSCPVVLQIFFDGYHKDQTKWPSFINNYENVEFLGLPLWKPDGKPVFVWSSDMISSGDERWIVFGPYKNEEEVKDRLSFIDVPGQSGYRIINEHCFTRLIHKEYGGEGYPRLAWTDG